MNPFASGMSAQPWLRGGLTPWHMWGNSIGITITEFETDAALPPATTGQLLKVAYGRPDTWHWLFHAQIKSAPPPSEDPAQLIVEVHFDLIIGHGRSQSMIPDFGYMRWSWVSPTSPFPNTPKWTTSGLSPGLVDSIVPPIGEDATTRQRVSQIVGQDIQVNCRAHAFKEDGFDPGMQLQVEVAGYFAPVSHIRPDWYLPEPAPLEAMFPGAETGGK